MSPIHVHRLAVRNELDDVAKVGEWLHEIAAANELPSDLLFRVDLCAAESVTNVISYAFDDVGTHPIELELRLDPEWAVLTVADGGRAFNPLALSPPTQPGSLEESTIGGLGIHLIRANVDACNYEHRQGRNLLSMQWRMPPARDAR